MCMLKLLTQVVVVVVVVDVVVLAVRHCINCVYITCCRSQCAGSSRCWPQCCRSCCCCLCCCIQLAGLEIDRNTGLWWYISQLTVTAWLDIWQSCYCGFSTEYAGEIILIIAQYLVMVWTYVWWLVWNFNLQWSSLFFIMVMFSGLVVPVVNSVY